LRGGREAIMQVAAECPVIGPESGPAVVPEWGSLDPRWSERDLAPGIDPGIGDPGRREQENP
jgi:hypothetical protein